MLVYTSVFFARPQKAKTISVEERNVNVANAPIADSPVIAVIWALLFKGLKIFLIPL